MSASCCKATFRPAPLPEMPHTDDPRSTGMASAAKQANQQGLPQCGLAMQDFLDALVLILCSLQSKGGVRLLDSEDLPYRRQRTDLVGLSGPSECSSANRLVESRERPRSRPASKLDCRYLSPLVGLPQIQSLRKLEST